MKGKDLKHYQIISGILLNTLLSSNLDTYELFDVKMMQLRDNQLYSKR